MEIPDSCLSRLRSAGLLVADHAFPANHVAYPDGCIVYKPEEAGGNCLPLLEHDRPRDDSPVIDAPRVVLHSERGKWVVTVRQGVPLPGPGDFIDEWDTPEQAVADVLDYFFGDPARMLVKRRAWEAERRRRAHMPGLVGMWAEVLYDAAGEGRMRLVQEVVDELRLLVDFGASAAEFAQAVQSAVAAASARGHQQVAEYLGSVM